MANVVIRSGQPLLALFILLLGLCPPLVLGQVPEWGRFEYVLYDNGDRPVGTYFFTIGKEGDLWRITSDMRVDTTFLFFPIRFKDQNTFTHDGNAFQSFRVSYYKDVPLQRTVQQEVSGVNDGNRWTIQSINGNSTDIRQIPRTDFEEIRNLISRLVRPEAVLRPGEIRKSRSLNPLTLEISEVESRGIEIVSVEFQGRLRDLYVMETRATDGNVRVHKFTNGLIYRSQTAEGYALLKSAQAPSF
jgi:hypothetical protein